MHMSVSSNDALLCTIGTDQSAKIFDVFNFDMINMIRLEFVPKTCGWIHRPSDPVAALAISERDTPRIHVFDGKGEAQAIHVMEKLHAKPVHLIQVPCEIEFLYFL